MRKLNAWGWYLMTMWLLTVIILILAWPFPCYWKSDWKFIGFMEVWDYLTWFYLLFIILFLVSTIIIIYWKCFAFKGSSPPSVSIIKCSPKSSEPLSFLASYFVPLVSFSVDKTTDQIVLLILLISIGIMFVKGDLFHLNPTLILLGFHIHEIEVKYQSISNKRNETEHKVVISKSNLSKDESIWYIPISTNLWYAIKK